MTAVDPLTAASQALQPNGCCSDPTWRGHLCDYHQGFEDGIEAARPEGSAVIPRELVDEWVNWHGFIAPGEKGPIGKVNDILRAARGGES